LEKVKKIEKSGFSVRFLLEADYEKVAEEVEKYLELKKRKYNVKEYSRPRMVKFKLGFMKSVTIAQAGRSTFVKAPAEFYDVLVQFKTKEVFGKIPDAAGLEIEKAILSAQEDAAKKTLILVVALTAFATPAMILKKLPPYSLGLLLFSLLPVKVKVSEFELEVSAFPVLYPYYALKKRRMKDDTASH